MKIRKFNESSELSDFTKRKEKGTAIPYFKKALSLFVDELPSDKIFETYLRDIWMENDGEGSLEMQEFINMNIKDECQWMTGIDIMECADKLVEGAIGNGNILNGK